MQQSNSDSAEGKYKMSAIGTTQKTAVSDLVSIHSRLVNDQDLMDRFEEDWGRAEKW